MRVPLPKRISRENLPGAPDWVDGILEIQSSMDPVFQALQGRLASENLNAQVKTLTVTVPEPTWIAPTFQNSWVNFGGVHGPAGYRILPGGVVELRGVVKNGTAMLTTAFTLPSGYRPPYEINFPVDSNAAFGMVKVKTSGDVYPYTGVTTGVTLDGIRFQATACAAPATFSGNDWPLVIKSEVQGAPIGVVPLQVLDLGDGSNLACGSLSVDWEYVNGQVKVRSIYGLQPGRKYRVRLLVLGE